MKIKIDKDRYEVHVDKKMIELTPKEFDLLFALQKANGCVMTRESLMESVWGYDRSMGIDTRTVDQHVARLRRKLGIKNSFIKTMPSRGYKLVQR